MSQKPEHVSQESWDYGKPDDVSQEAWDKAAVGMDYAAKRRALIARAIMVAEESKLQDCLDIIESFRQTALSVAETAKDGGFDRERDDAFLIAYTAGDLATAIRKRAGGAKP